MIFAAGDGQWVGLRGRRCRRLPRGRGRTNSGEPAGPPARHSGQPRKGIVVANGQTGKRSRANWVATNAVILALGLWGSWIAWTTASPFEARPRPRELPQEYVLLTCSLLCLYAAALIGGWLVSRTRVRAPGARSPLPVLSGAVTLYGLIATATFALATASEWSLAAVLPLGLMAYFHIHMARSVRGAGAGQGDADVQASTGAV